MKISKSDIIFLGLVGMFLAFAIFVIAPNIKKPGGGGSPEVLVVEAENKANIIDTAMMEIKEMELLELMDLRKRILDFKEFSSFNFDVSGILDIFK